MSNSEVNVRLNPSFSDWYEAKLVVEDQLQVIGQALERIRVSSKIQDALTGHLFAVHHQWCEACPPKLEPALSGGALDKGAPKDTVSHAATDMTRGGHSIHSQLVSKTIRCVSAFTQTTSTDVDLNGHNHRLNINSQDGLNDKNDDVSENLIPSSVTCQDEDFQSDVNRIVEKPSSENVGNTKLVKLEVSEGVQFPAELVVQKLQKDHCDKNSSREEIPSQQIYEEELPSQHIESGEQVNDEGASTILYQQVKQERDSQEHFDYHMEGSSFEAVHQESIAENPCYRLDGQLHLEGVHEGSDQKIKQEPNLEDNNDVDMEEINNEAMSHKGPMEEIPHARTDEQRVEGMNEDQCIKSKRDVAGTSSMEASHQGCGQEIPPIRSEGTEKENAGSSITSEVPTKEITEDQSLTDVTGNASSSITSEVLAKEVTEDNHLTDGTEKENAGSSITSEVPTKEITEDQSLTGVKSCKKVKTGSCRYQCSSNYKNSCYEGDMEVQGNKHGKFDHCSSKNTNKSIGQRQRIKEKMSYMCHVCGKRFSFSSLLKRHVRTHSGEKPYCCTICDYKCSQKGSLDSCTICDYKCSQKSHLNINMKVHPGEKPYECLFCGKGFSRSGSLKSHMRIHSGEKPYSCNICDYRCSLKGYLNVHMRVHSGEKANEYYFYGKKFVHSGRLKIHMRGDTGKKPYSCTLCDYRCSQKGSLTSHMKVHSGEKPYECSFCGKAFSQAGNLKRHIRTHSGEKPYECSFCGKGFSQSGYLKIHMRIHNGEKPYSCNICDYKCCDRSNLRKHHLRIHDLAT